MSCPSRLVATPLYRTAIQEEVLPHAYFRCLRAGAVTASTRAWSLTRPLRRLAAPDVQARWDVSPKLHRDFVVHQVLAVLLGVALLVGGEEKMRTSRSFDVMLQLGGPWPWGLALVGGALCMVIAQRISLTACHWALRIGSGVYSVIAVSFAAAAWGPGGATWWGFLLLAVGIAWDHLSDAEDYRPAPPATTPQTADPTTEGDAPCPAVRPSL